MNKGMHFHFKQALKALQRSKVFHEVKAKFRSIKYLSIAAKLVLYPVNNVSAFVDIIMLYY
jgi:hypothetical protein